MLLQELGIILKPNQEITPPSPAPSSEKKALDIWASIETPFIDANTNLKSLQACRLFILKYYRYIIALLLIKNINYECKKQKNVLSNYLR